MSVLQVVQDSVSMVQSYRVVCQPYNKGQSSTTSTSRAADITIDNVLPFHLLPKCGQKRTTNVSVPVPILKRVRGSGPESSDTFHVVSSEKNPKQKVLYNVFKDKTTTKPNNETLKCSKPDELSCSLISTDESTINGCILQAEPPTIIDNDIKDGNDVISDMSWMTQPLEVGGEVILDDRTHIETGSANSVFEVTESINIISSQISPCTFSLDSDATSAVLDSVGPARDSGLSDSGLAGHPVAEAALGDTDLSCDTSLGETVSMPCDTDTSYYLCIDNSTGELVYVDEATLPSQDASGLSSQDTHAISPDTTQQQPHSGAADGNILADVGAETVVVTTVVACDTQPATGVSSNVHSCVEVLPCTDTLTLPEPHCDSDISKTNLWIPADASQCTSDICSESELLEVSLPHILCATDTSDYYRHYAQLTGFQEGDLTIREVNKRERDKEAKRKLRESAEFRLKERVSARERMAAKRADPEWREQERLKDRLRRRQSRIRNTDQRNTERERDKISKRKTVPSSQSCIKLITECPEMYNIEPICSDSSIPWMGD